MELVTVVRITWFYSVPRRPFSFGLSTFLWLIRRLYSKSRFAHWLGIDLILSRWFYYVTYTNTLGVCVYSPRYYSPSYKRGAAKSLARPGRKQVTATEDFDVHISYLLS